MPVGGAGAGDGGVNAPLVGVADAKGVATAERVEDGVVGDPVAVGNGSMAGEQATTDRPMKAVAVTRRIEVRMQVSPGGAYGRETSGPTTWYAPKPVTLPTPTAGTELFGVYSVPGTKSSADRSWPASPPPATSTLPSGSRVIVWLARGVPMLAAAVH